MRRPEHWQIRTRVAALLIAGTLVPLLIVGVLDLAATTTAIFAAQGELLGARSDQLAGEIDQFNLRYVQASRRLAGVPEVSAFLEAAEPRTDARPALQALLMVDVAGDPAVRGIGVVDLAGAVVAITDPSASPATIASRGYFRDASARRSTISSVYVDAAAEDQPTVAYVAPVYGDDGGLGYVVFWVRAEALWELVGHANGRAGAGSFAVLVDDLGIRIAHTSQRGAVFHPTGPLAPEIAAALVAERRFGDHTRALIEDVHAFPAQFERGRAAPDPEMFRGYSVATGSHAYGASRRLTTVPWTVFCMVPETTMTAPIAMARWQKLLLACIVLLATGALGLGFARQIIRPLRQLGAVADRLAAGDVAARVSLGRRGDEIGALAAQFNAMAGQVATAQQRLEAEVAARTAELRRANDSLQTEERKYREIYEQSPDMYLTADMPTDRIIDCNRTLCDRLGYAKHELIGQPVDLIYHADYISGDRAAAMRQFLDVGEFVDVERTLRKKDGGRIAVSLNVRAVRDVDGTITAARAVWRDISARKQGELDLRLLVRLGEVLRSSTDEAAVLHAVCIEIARHLEVPRCAFIEVDRAADLITIHRDVHGASPSIAGRYTVTQFGQAIAEEASRGATVVISDTVADPRTAAQHDPSYRAIDVRAYVAVPLLRNGEWMASLTVSSPAPRSWEPREIHLLGLVAERAWVWIEHLRVLTELRDQSVARAVARSEARFRILVEAIEDYAVFMLDPDGVVATWNAGAQRIKGYTADEVLGQPIDRFYTAEDLARGHPREVLDRARTQGRYEEEGWRVRKDGTRFWATITLTAVRDPDGALEGFAKVTRDSSERRQHDDELRARQAQLVQHLKERDVLLQEIHHRVKNNLQVISSLISMQVRKLEPGASRAALEECQTRVLAIALIHEKLYQSKNYAEVQFAEYARSLAANVFHTLGVSPSEVSLDLAIDPIPLSIDRAIPCGLLINELITNALKHAFPDHRSGVVRVSLARAGEQLQLEVRDNGIGLGETWDAYKMKSMGLQLVVTLTEQLGGTLAVTGRGGAAFQVTFPRGA
jgi:PAS domain S-box-containing protein